MNLLDGCAMMAVDSDVFWAGLSLANALESIPQSIYVCDC